MALKDVLRTMVDAEDERTREVGRFFLSLPVEMSEGAGVRRAFVGECGHRVVFNEDLAVDLLTFHGIDALYSLFDQLQAEMALHVTKDACDKHRAAMAGIRKWDPETAPPSDVKKMEVNLPPYLVAELERRCRDQNKTMTQVLKEAISVGVNPKPELKLEHLQSTPVVLKDEGTALAPKLTLLVRQGQRTKAQVVDVRLGADDEEASFDDDAAALGLVSYVRADLLSRSARLEFVQEHAKSMALVRSPLADEHAAIDEILNSDKKAAGVHYVVEKWVSTDPEYSVDSPSAASFDTSEVVKLETLDQANRWQAKSVIADFEKTDFDRMQFRIYKVTSASVQMSPAVSLHGMRELLRTIPDSDTLYQWRLWKKDKSDFNFHLAAERNEAIAEFMQILSTKVEWSQIGSTEAPKLECTYTMECGCRMVVSGHVFEDHERKAAALGMHVGDYCREVIGACELLAPDHYDQSICDKYQIQHHELPSVTAPAGENKPPG